MWSLGGYTRLILIIVSCPIEDGAPEGGQRGDFVHHRSCLLHHNINPILHAKLPGLAGPETGAVDTGCHFRHRSNLPSHEASFRALLTPVISRQHHSLRDVIICLGAEEPTLSGSTPSEIVLNFEGGEGATSPFDWSGAEEIRRHFELVAVSMRVCFVYVVRGRQSCPLGGGFDRIEGGGVCSHVAVSLKSCTLPFASRMPNGGGESDSACGRGSTDIASVPPRGLPSREPLVKVSSIERCLYWRGWGACKNASQEQSVPQLAREGRL